MTDIKLMALLEQYYGAQRDVAVHMRVALMAFAGGNDASTWLNLFGWCEAKDRREELWKTFKHHYPRAMMMKEGHYP